MVRCSYQCLFFFLVSTNPNAIFIHNDQKPDTLIDLFGILFSISTFSIFTFFFCFFWEQQSVSAPLVAPIYFATYIIAVFFILMNMMISIIIMGFEQAKSEQASKQNLYGQSFFFVSSLFFQFTMFCFLFVFFFSFLNCQLFFNFFFSFFLFFLHNTLIVKVPFVYDSTTTKLKTWFFRCQKGCGWGTFSFFQCFAFCYHYISKAKI